MFSNRVTTTCHGSLSNAGSSPETHTASNKCEIPLDVFQNPVTSVVVRDEKDRSSESAWRGVREIRTMCRRRHQILSPVSMLAPPGGRNNQHTMSCLPHVQPMVMVMGLLTALPTWPWSPHLQCFPMLKKANIEFFHEFLFSE
ncbi:hypothetical protein BaRGS_00014132 [Batillaria attramentaria]|uniref:Uncharacterized protein n=1 Tax=Batillaria attramentaria TaxID=370345 RepID=A0ABD0L5P0_9CAEN